MTRSLWIRTLRILFFWESVSCRRIVRSKWVKEGDSNTRFLIGLLVSKGRTISFVRWRESGEIIFDTSLIVDGHHIIL